LIVVAGILLVLALPYFLLNRESRPMDATARAAATGQFVTLPDGVVHYELAGPPDGRLVVLVHGFSVPSFIWDGTFEALTDAGFRVLRYDLYGRGYSDRPNVAYTTDLFVRQLSDLLDALGVKEPVDLVGLSLGGYISTAFTDRHPERVRRLALLDPGPSSPSQFTLVSQLMAAPVLGNYFITAFGDLYLPASQKTDFYRVEKMPAGYLDRYRDQMQYRGFKGAVLSTMRNQHPDGLMDLYARVGGQGRPLLLIWGQEDKTVPFADNAGVRQVMPNAEFHAIPEAGHLPHIEQPEVVNGLLLEFLQR